MHGETKNPEASVFYLDAAACVWFENFKSFLRSGAFLRTEFLKPFTTRVHKKPCDFATDEGVLFIEEMKVLFRRYDAAIAEEKTLSVFYGVASS